MRDKTHMENVEKWAKFVKENPNKWRKIHDEFINAQFKMHKQFITRLLKTSRGKEKLIKLYNIKNISAYSQLKSA
jgi:hypothetical protein